MSEITWYGHSAFHIRSSGATGAVSVLIDPFFSPASGIKADETGPTDLVLVTHDHADHTGEAVAICRRTGAMLGAITGTAGKLARSGLPEKQICNGIGFNMGGTIVCKGARVTMTPACHSSDSGAPAGYILAMPDGVTVYHAGDTCLFGGMELWGRLYSIDVALLPIGGLFTMDAPQAAHACGLLRCRQVVPMHWGTFPALAQSTAEFREELARLSPSCSCIDMAPGATVTVS
jgi:L-ascorbate metabolism protein UlaG (beta-lactamase superfamily)